MMGTSFHRAVVEHPWTGTRQGFLMFAIAVAGKRADQTAGKLRYFLGGFPDLSSLPFMTLRKMEEHGVLEQSLRRAALGRYSVLTRAYRYLAGRADEDPSTWSLEELEAIPGVGPKTARYFLLYTTDRENIAALDTHILKFLRDFGYDAPKQTPSGKQYKRWEKIFCAIARGVYALTPRELDDMVWRYYARGEDTGLWADAPRQEVA